MLSAEITMPDQGFLSRFIGRLRFPQLFFLAAILLGIDLVVPDAIPFLDEALLALLTAMLSMLRRRAPQPDPGPPDRDRIEKNVTPREALRRPPRQAGGTPGQAPAPRKMPGTYSGSAARPRKRSDASV